ncbi:NADH dehydrogenase [ubiquinone] 1 alpha subcomplex subunit 5 [Dermochelys coriacea]|uniref:NADH dehydrogenase [ubiquinone] 1 alpha subcomplex subunit 5 n=1 Tax=Dermochelys coriacea TaxID=27794 RepID=UPI0018E8CAC4|nr:NADH dehydrogenase [ubiquinone] 1 alpha subcomplex subunit 5 [Dermochelys coriacea]
MRLPGRIRTRTPAPNSHSFALRPGLLGACGLQLLPACPLTNSPKILRGACAVLVRPGRWGSVLYCLAAAMAGALKKTTGLVGLAVAETPHEHLRILYTKILTALQDIPKDAAYRKYTEQIVNERFNMVKTEPNVEKLEDKMKSGQIEEVIIQAENELSLARKMVQWKPWEPLVEEPPTDQWRWPI